MSTPSYQRALEKARTWSPSESADATIQAAAAVHRERVKNRKRMVIALATTIVLSAAAIVLVVRSNAPVLAPIVNAPPPRVAQLGPRVMVASDPDAQFAIEQVSAAETAVRIARGTVLFQLDDGAESHRLLAYTGNVEVRATGTIFSVAASEHAAPEIEVIAGSVEVRTGTGAASRIDAAPGAHSPQLLPLLEALARAPRIETALRPPPENESNEKVAPAKVVRRRERADARVESELDASVETPAETSTDKWRRARLLRGQARFTEAITVLEELAATRDPVWEPLANIEQMRIYESVLLKPKEVARLGLRFLETYPKHSLVNEARTMTCRAEKALGEESTHCGP